MKQKPKKIVSIFMLMLILFNIFIPLAQAVSEMKSAYISANTSYAPYYVNYNGHRTHAYFITYNNNGKEYPAYCANYGLDGADLNNSYTVDIDSTYSNNKVWRALKNGYPYSSISAMGLKDKYEAYYVTKQAIYCALGQKDISLYSPISGYEYIYNSLVNLVNYVQNGTETYKDPTVTLSKDGVISKQTINKNTFYVQNYTVTSNLEFATFNVFISNFPEGTQILNEDNIPKTEYTGTTKFKVAIPENNIKGNITGNIEIKDVQVKTYPILYGKTRVEKTQDYIIATDIYETTGSNTTLNLNTNTCKIIVNKTDIDTNKPIQGVVFDLYNSSGTIVATATTDSNGVANFSNLYPGKYIIKEKLSTLNYVLDTSSYEVYVKYNEISKLELTNNHKKGSIKIYKVDADNNQIGLENVEFKLYSYEFDKIIGTYYTKANGELYIDNLRTGKYKLIESNSGSWYNLSDDVEIEIKHNQTEEIVIENELKKGSIKVIKVDSENNEIKLQGVKFEVLDTKGNVLETIITDKKGEAYTSKYAIRDFQKLILKEVQTLENYKLDETSKEIILEANQIKTVTFNNEKIKGKIKIVKTSEDNNKINGKLAGSPIQGVIFDIYDVNNKKVSQIETNEFGIAISEELEKGKYYIKEKKPGKWYILNNQKYYFEIIDNDQVIELNIKNKSDNPNLDIEKTGTIEAIPNKEIRYDFKIKNTGNTALSNFTWIDKIPTDYVKTTKLVTGTYNQSLNYSIHYKTNKYDYKILADNLDTQISTTIDLTKLELAEDEYITEIKIYFKQVNVGFESVTAPSIFANVKEGILNSIFTNYVKIEGNNKGYIVWDEDTHTTTIHQEKLPKTGY